MSVVSRCTESPSPQPPSTGLRTGSPLGGEEGSIPSSDWVVRTQNLGKCYKLYARPFDRLKELFVSSRRYHHDFWALQEVDLHLEAGQSCGIIGRNGSGKSTLLKLISGVTRPSCGTVEATGRVGALLELGTGFHPEYTGRENIYFSAAMLGLEGAETEALVPEIIAFAELDDFIDQPVKTYSSGMYMRLGFAVATSIRPDILITDEVLAVGDEAFHKKCIRRMEAFLGQGKTLLFCSHSMYHVQKLCQKALWLDHGRVRAWGGVAEVTLAFEDYMRELEAQQEQPPEAPPVAAAALPSRLRQVRLLGADDQETDAFDMGDTARLEMIAEVPDGQPPVFAVGHVRRNDKFGVYGIFSDMDQVEPQRVDACTFRIGYEVCLSLLPGNYTFRTHVLDHTGLRMFDTIEKDFSVRGESRELGVCRLPHRWT